ncbi:MAG: galactose-1-phosphate uridylyltransferase [Patescibacteria group bacterium]|nr:galactose-1-phosphate uridylyltransferase [Patescibacteria group bacterium]MDD5554272.1 galactose-1-phosphate uridylyltransferase [Patescibacteria group bacterium]
MGKIKPEIRKSYLLDKYVIITPNRADRPRDIKEETIVKRVKSCFFCPKNINQANVVDRLPASGNSKNWQVLAIKNIFPAVEISNKKAYGQQEVIIETPIHTRQLADLTENQIAEVLRMYIRRTETIAKNKKIKYILCFKNQGSKAGASIIHAHSQIFATAIIPPELAEEERAVKNYRAKTGHCPYCDIIKKEIRGKRKIFADKFIAAFAPYASEYHYEAWIFPKRHLDNITLLNADEIKSLAKALKMILTKMKSLNLSFNYFLHNSVFDKSQHLYLKIQPRDSVWAGVELGSGIVINSVSPEEAAKYLKS